MVPERSPESNFAKHVFYTEINDINVFIEDTEKGIKKLFIELITRALPKLNITEVFPLGGRNNVLKKHKEYLEGKYTSKKNNIFIVDGDLYLLNQSIINSNGLLGLNKYCIENFLIDDNAIIEYLYYEDSEQTREQIKRTLDFPNWINSNLPLVYLFILYSISHNMGCGLQTTSFNVKKLIKSNQGIVDKKEVRRKILSFKKELLLKTDFDTYREQRNFFFLRASKTTNSLLTYVSGKDYLMPLLILKMKQITNFSYTNENLKLKLAKECNCDYFKQINDIMI
jgi:hypothetical protein